MKRTTWTIAIAAVLLLSACGQQLRPPTPEILADDGGLATSAGPTELFFSEYVEGSSNNKALEIFNGTGAAIDLGAGGYNVQMFFNGSTSAGLTINLVGTVAAGDVFVLAQSAANATILAQADQTNGAGWFNGDDAVVLRKGTALLDVIGQIGFDPGTEWGSGLASTADNTLRRKPTVVAGDTDGSNAFEPALEWDGYATDTFNGLGSHGGDVEGEEPEACGLPFTPIHEIQGSGAASPLVGQTVTTQGVVVGDFEGPTALGALRGFYLQDPEGDGDPATSDGIFVFNGNLDSVAVGDLVRVSGTAAEFQNQTQITASGVIACGTGTVDPVDVTLPVTDATYLERYEGMLVRFNQTLVVTEMFQLGRFGQVVMSGEERLLQPTQVVAPGPAALALQATNTLNRIIVDDALNNQNPLVLFGRGGQPLSAANTLRGGDTATNLVGVLTYTWAGNAASGNAYRLRTQNALGGGEPDFQPTNPRPTTAPDVGGSLRVGALNVLNYFDTFGRGACTNGVAGGSTDCRGADNAIEFERQAAKTVASILGMDVDVLGLIEIENDGYGLDSAIADLVDRLNAAAGTGTWAFIDADARTGQVDALGSDAIKVGFLYRPAAVQPVGTTAALNGVDFVNAGDPDPRNRPALAQAFASNGSGAVFVAAVNHLKSKGSACSVPDAGDGQGNCSAVRTTAAGLLVDWLAGDPTGMGDADVVILGDLNAYAKEDAVAAIEAADFVNLQARFGGDEAYGYVFDGQWGSLDYALASRSLDAQVVGAAAWHTNADEPTVLDYNTNFKSPAQIVDLFAPDEFRASDHDPLIVGIDLTATPTCAAAQPSIRTLWPVNHKYVRVAIQSVVTSAGLPANVVVTSVFQDEPVDAPGDLDGHTSPDAAGLGANSVLLRAERYEGGNGRVYHVGFVATDGLGQSCVGSVQVKVAANKGRNGAAIDDGPLYDSTVD